MPLAIIDDLFHNDAFLFFGVVIGIPVIVGGVIAVTKLLIKHRERMAMIEQGMHPDDPTARATRPRHEAEV